jgi:hypothetical protein
VKSVSPPKLSTCIAAYYGVLVLFGVIGSALAPSAVEPSLGEVLSGGLWLLFLTHVFFVLAIAIQGDWLSYVLVVGIPVAIIVAMMRLNGWPRNAAVIGLLFAAHAYGLAVAGMNG